MTDIRKEALKAFIQSTIHRKGIVLLALNGDASFRRYFRFDNYIAVDAPPKTQKNLEFITIDKELSAVGVRVPKVLAYDLDNGFMLLEDLGNTLFADVAVGENRQRYYEKAVELLGLISKVNIPALPDFDESFIRTELSIFTEWMVDKTLHLTLSDTDKTVFDKTFAILVDNCLAQKQIAMHRDYHCRNLMLVDDDLATIDFQDMVKGPFTYDLASLLYDCYVVLDETLITKLMHQAYSMYAQCGFIKDLSFDAFVKQVRLTSLQRHIKVLGIFCRLHLRDGKDGYLKDLPRVIDYVLRECAAYPEFSQFGLFIEQHIKGKF